MKMVLEDIKKRYLPVLNIDCVVPSKKADRLTMVKHEKVRRAVAQQNLSSPRKMLDCFGEDVTDIV